MDSASTPNSPDSGPGPGGLGARTAPTRRVFVDQGRIEDEIRAGLPNQMDRMRDAYDSLRYSMARFEEYPTRHRDARFKSPSVRRTLPVFKRIMEILCMHLYKAQPTRKLGKDRAVSEWLERVYRRNHMWARFRRADQLTLVGGYCGFQFAGGTDPQSPLRVNLWSADQIAFWTSPTDATDVGAVATVDIRDNERRLTLWTKDEIVTFLTAKGLVHPAMGGTAYQETGFDGKPSRRPNPYQDRDGNGIIPFAFPHWSFPVSDFETNSPGNNLRELNEGINERLDNLGDSIYFNARPIGVARGVDDGWTPPAEIRPGDFITLPADNVDAAGNGAIPTLEFLMADLQYISKDWEDLAGFLDNTLEMWGIPPSLIRMVQSGARSGAAIQSEQLPILGWVEGRRADWSVYEEEAARTAVQVAEAHLYNNKLLHDADDLQRVLDDWSFSLRWPSLYIQLPGPDRDAADDWRITHSQVSLIGIAQERMDLTEDEAFDHISKVAEQNARLQAIGVNPMPGPAGLGALGGPPPPAGGPAPPGADQGDEQQGDGRLPGLSDPEQGEGTSRAAAVDDQGADPAQEFGT